MLINLRKLLCFMLLISVVMGVFNISFAEKNVIDSDLFLNEHTLTSYNSNTNSISIYDEDIFVSEVLTFEELTNQIAKDNNISLTEAKNQIIQNFDDGPLLNESNLLGINPYNATYRTVSTQFTVNSFYKPSLRFYCQTSEGGSWWGIVQIMNVGMDRNYNGTTKQFGGTVYTNLESASRIFWIVNGDFYNNGTTNYNGGVQIKVSESATVNFSVSYSSNHYAYKYEERRVNIY